MENANVSSIMCPWEKKERNDDSMDTRRFSALIDGFLLSSGWNTVAAECAIDEEMIGLRIFDSPLLGVATADHPLFRALRGDGVIGPHFLLPEEWLPGARSVISFFLPFSESVRRANRADRNEPAPEWLHGRIEGQRCIDRLSAFLVEQLLQDGHSAVAPSIEDRFLSCATTNTVFLDDDGVPLQLSFSSNWSERHVAYVCGLGSFGLSKGLITPKGVAGRFGSVVTTAPVPPDNVIASAVYENCTMCGACVRNCPVGAITIEKGKNHILCAEFLDLTKRKYQPRYGCGKCQTGVPCEHAIPAK